jgi:putative peptidoglycan lipid II flippase
MVPAIFGSSVAQINVLVSGIIASLLPVGSISYLYYSDRLMEFPLGLFGIALATVTLPYLSRLWANDDKVEFAETLEWSMKIALLIAVPAAIGLIVLAAPLVTTLFHGGEFSARSVEMTAIALQAYAVGLIGFSYVKVLAPAFFAREDTRTPVRIGIAALLVNVVLGSSAAWYMTTRGIAGPHMGLAAATSIAAVLNAVLLYRGLRKAGVVSHGTGWGGLLLRVLLANTAMIGVLWQLHRDASWWLSNGLADRVTWLAISVVAGAGVYFLALLVLGMRTAQFRMRQS